VELLRKFRWFLYISVFLLIFFFGAFCSFPQRDLKQIADIFITKAALSMPPSKTSSPIVRIDNISLWRLSGINIKNLSISWPSFNDVPSTDLLFNSFKARVGIFSYLFGNKSISSQINMYDGYFNTNFKLDKNNSLKSLYIDSNKINLSKMNIITSISGLNIGGELKTNITIDNNSDKLPDSSGHIVFNIKNGSLLVNNLSALLGGMGGTIDLPSLALGEINADLEISKKEVTSKTFKISGGDLQAEITLIVSLDNNLSSSKINARGWFSLKQSLIDSNETLKTLYDILPQLKASKMTDNKVGFSVNGTLRYPNFNLEVYTANMEKKL
jgi:type II secretion system protein N